MACHPRDFRYPLKLARVVFGAAKRPRNSFWLGRAFSSLGIAIAMAGLESECEDIAPERAISRERDERLAQIAEGELPELVHQSPGAAATIGHGDDGGNPTLVAFEAGEHREWASSATDGDHLLVEQVGAHVG